MTDTLAAYQEARAINRAFYARLTRRQANARLAPRSASARTSAAHQIRIQHEYIQSLRTGRLEFGVLYGLERKLRRRKMRYLLAEMDRADEELRRLVSHARAPWACVILGHLRDHEILHTGWNLAMMDMLGLPRYPELIAVWGE